MSLVSAKKFNQSPSMVKAMARQEPVFVTDRGKTSLVVLSAEEYARLTGSQTARRSLLMEDGDDIDFQPVIDRTAGRTAEL